MTPIIAAHTTSWIVNKIGKTADMGGFGSQFRRARRVPEAAGCTGTARR
jgi:hypothetical protein